MALAEKDRAKFEADLREALGPRVALEQEQRLVYECDAQTLSRVVPDGVVFPESTREVQATIQICNRYDVPFLARGAGTGLSGGAVAARMERT